MDKAKARDKVNELNAALRRAIEKEIEDFTKNQIGMPVSDWIQQATFNDLIGMSLIVKAEKERLMEKVTVYHLAVWNERGKKWAKTHLKDLVEAEWFEVTRIGDGYKAYTIGRITSNVLIPIPVECLDIV